LPFNSDNYSIAHPALSVDEKTLYFASDMPGTLGQSDLFSVSINEDGTFGKPVNLGKNINTEGRETFPFISKGNELYFASDGRPGLGGLDIFVSMMDVGNNFGEVQNIGEPVNGPQDYFAFLIDSKNHNGYFTSNRVGGLGLDDIYRFTELSKLSARYLLVGTVTDQENGAVLANANVRLFDERFQLIKETISNTEGRYQFEVLPGKHYYVRAEKMDYETKEGGVVISDKVEKTDLSIALEKRIKAAAVGMDLAKIIDIPVIYFDLDKSDITKEGAFELEKILDIMTQYPKMRIDIRSHTDSRQSVSYNEALSERRAVSTRNWLINKGIDATRLTAKGYGESRLLNGCSDGVKCSEKEHQANRRSEFMILSME
jgi:outer membrane protein OmpA-like peptidoglycan-associated protein